MSNYGDWRTDASRRSIVARIDQVVRESALSFATNCVEMENQMFMKAKTREEYLEFVEKLITQVRETNGRNVPVFETCIGRCTCINRLLFLNQENRINNIQRNQMDDDGFQPIRIIPTPDGGVRFVTRSVSSTINLRPPTRMMQQGQLQERLEQMEDRMQEETNAARQMAYSQRPGQGTGYSEMNGGRQEAFWHSYRNLFPPFLANRLNRVLPPRDIVPADATNPTYAHAFFQEYFRFPTTSSRHVQGTVPTEGQRTNQSQEQSVQQPLPEPRNEIDILTNQIANLEDQNRILRLEMEQMRLAQEQVASLRQDGARLREQRELLVQEIDEVHFRLAMSRTEDVQRQRRNRQQRNRLLNRTEEQPQPQEWQFRLDDKDESNEPKNEATLCPICMERKIRYTLKCGHVLCGNCCNKICNVHRTLTCPTCRAPIKTMPTFLFLG